MKYSMCSAMTKERSLENVLELAHSMNLDGVEIWVGHIEQYLQAGHSLQDLAQMLESLKLSCVGISPYLDFVDESKEAETQAMVDTCLAYCVALRCRMIRVFLGYKSSADVTEKEWEHCAQALKVAARKAEAAGVVLAIETHNDQPSDYAAAILSLLDWVASPAVQVLFDGVNMISTGQQMMEVYVPLKEHVVHVHMKNKDLAKDCFKPVGEGDLDFVPVLRALKDDGYDAYISFEYSVENPEEIIRKSKAWVEETLEALKA